ncbi:MAG: hypothetical protein DSZ03_08960 [Sulfurimonas sp.]|nr:MAG: hypothetical protein DSZ03_08960 [Sulfurimonas sp.]
MFAQDLVMILVYTFPMFLFMIFPAIKLADYIEDKYKIQERQKRVIIIVSTFLGALILATLLQLM